MHTYLVVFQYTANRALFTTNKVVSLNHLFSAKDVEIQEKIASEENQHKSRIISIIAIEPSP